MNPSNLLSHKKSIIIYFILFLIVPYFLTNSILNKNYNIFLIIVASFIAFFVIKSNLFALSLILFLMFFGNWLEDLNLIPGQLNWLTEILIFLMLMKAASAKTFRKEKMQFKYSSSVLLCLSIILVSCMFNLLPLVVVGLFLRMIFRYYLLFVAVLNLGFNERSMRTVINIIIFLFLVQIPTAIIKLFIYGQGESAIGTYSAHGGGGSAVLPLVAISFLIAFYFFYRSSRNYPLVAVAYTAFGLIGGKRAILVYIPILILFLGFYLKKQLKNIKRFAFVGILFILLTGYFSIKYLPSLNPEKRIGGSVDLSYLKNFLVDYNMASQDGVTYGRISTTINVFNYLREDGFLSVLLGRGPGRFMKTRFVDVASSVKETRELRAIYGVTGLSWLALQIGYLGSIVYLYLFYRVFMTALLYYRSETKPYWKAFGFGMVGFSFVILLISVSYWDVFNDDLIPGIFFILAAFLVQMSDKLKYLNKNKISHGSLSQEGLR